MNRRLQFVNLIGVLVLTVVCVLQWRRDRALNLELNQSEKMRLEQQTKLAEQEKNLRGLTDDLALFKAQLGQAQTESAEDRKRFAKLERENQLLTAVRDQLQESVTNWSNAVRARDERIAEANQNIRTLNDRTRALTEQLNASIQKFNDLVTNYNAVVEELNTARRTRVGD